MNDVHHPVRSTKRLTPWRRAMLASALGGCEPLELLRLFRFWLYSGVPDGDETSLKALQRATMLAQSPLEWCATASGYDDYGMHVGQSFDHKIKECMERAESVARKSSDWLYCACCWETLGDGRRAVRNLGIAVATAVTVSDYCHITFESVFLFENLDAAKTMLEEAKALASTPKDWEEINRQQHWIESEINWRNIQGNCDTRELSFMIINRRVVGIGKCAGLCI